MLNSNYRPEFIPNIIVGDFDSIKPEVKEFYTKKNVECLMIQDQDSCDLEKCLYIALEKLVEKEDSYKMKDKIIGSKDHSIIVFGASGGRIDHTFSTFHCVLKFSNTLVEQLINTEIYMVSNEKLSVFLKKGINTLKNLPFKFNKEIFFSLIPLSGEGNIILSHNEKEKSNSFILYCRSFFTIWRKGIYE